MDLAVLVSWIAAGVFAVLLLVVLRREVPRRLAPGLVAAISASLVFAVGDALWRQTPLESPAHWPMLLLMWAGVGSVPPAWWALALSFAHQHGEFRAGRALRFTPAYLQAFFFGLLLTNPFHGQFLTPAAHRSDFHWIAWLHASVTYATLLATLGVYGWLALRARRRAVRAQSAFMALGSLVPAAANVVYVASPRPPAIDPTMVAAVVSSLLLVYLITRRQLFELSPVDFSEVRRQDSDAVLLLDPRGRLLDANPASRALFGRVLEDPDAALERVAKALEPLHEAPDGARANAEHLARGIASPGELFTLAAADTRQLRITTIALMNARGRRTALLLRARDETELAQANARARSHAALLEAIFDAAGLAVLVLDRAGRLRFANRLMQEIWGSPLDDVIGSTARAALERRPPSNLGSVAQISAVLERCSRDTSAVFREDFALADGRVIELVSVPMREAERVTGRLFVNADVTERRRQEAGAREAARLEDLSRVAGGVAHGFNNLLTAVMGNTELALMQSQQPRAARHLGDVLAAAERGAELANQLLAYAGRAPMRRARVELAALIDAESRALRAQLPEPVALGVAVERPLAAVAGDATQLAHALQVVLRNAAQALHPGGGAIAIDARNEGGEVVIRVRDDGVGMDEATLARAFEPFFSTKPKAKGLGLSAARGIVAQHGGSLIAESAAGAGATLTLRLPSASGEALSAPELPRATEPSAARWRGAGRLLVVDDEAPTLSVSRELTQALGFEVVAVDGPSAALDAWRAAGAAFRVALIDATMPECDGPELLRQLRLDAPALPAVIYSGYTRESFSLPDEPPTEFLHKPFSLEDLAAALRRVLREEAR